MSSAPRPSPTLWDGRTATQRRGAATLTRGSFSKYSKIAPCLPADPALHCQPGAISPRSSPMSQPELRGRVTHVLGRLRYPCLRLHRTEAGLPGGAVWRVASGVPGA